MFRVTCYLMIFKTESGWVSNEIPGIGSGSGTRWALKTTTLKKSWALSMSYIRLKRSKRWYAICTLSSHLNGLQNSQKYRVNSGNLYAGADLDRNVRPSVGRKATIELFEAASNFSSVEFKRSTMPEQERRSHGFEVFVFAFVYCCVLNCCVFSWHAGDPGGGANAKTSQVCSSTPE